MELRQRMIGFEAARIHLPSHTMRQDAASLIAFFLVVTMVGCNDPQLITAVGKQDVAGAAKLLKSNIDVNEKSRAGETSLHIAIRLADKRLFQLLLDHGADANICDQDGASVVHRAAEQSSNEWLAIVKKHGADLDRENVGNRHFPGKTPLFYAIDKGRSDCVQFLVEAGASLNHQDRRGNTPLIRAVEMGMYREALLMLKHGADPRLLTQSGESLLDLDILSSGRDAVIQDQESRSHLIALRQYLLNEGLLK